MNRSKEIIVCATQRCGSTMVCEDMTSMGVLGRPLEYFLNWRPERDADWATEIETILSRGMMDNSVFSAKLMANQIRNIDKCFSTFVKPSRSGIFPHLVSFFENASWVWIRRRDTLAQAISHIIAKETGIYHVVKKFSATVPGSSITQLKFDRSEPADIPYEFQKVMQEWYFFKHQELLWELFFTENGISPLVIWYEDSIDTPYVGKIASTVGVSIENKVVPNNLVKMSGDQSKQIREKFMTDFFARQ